MDLLDFEEQIGTQSQSVETQDYRPTPKRTALPARGAGVAQARGRQLLQDPATERVSTPPPARRRNTSMTPILDDSTLAPSPEQDHNSSNATQKICDGCTRIYLVSSSYFVLGQTVEWPYQDGRGNVCRVCLRTHSSILQSRGVSLPRLASWISSHMETWATCRLAYLSLRQEGHVHVNANMMSSRIQLLEWMSRFCWDVA